MAHVNQARIGLPAQVLRLSSIGAMTLCAMSPASAGYFGPQSVERMRVHETYTMLRISGSPPNVCTNYGDQLMVDNSVAYGKQVIAVVLAAQLSNRRIVVWYNDSTAPGTTETNGCTGSSLAKITGVQLAD